MMSRLSFSRFLLLAAAAGALLAGCGGDQIARTGSGGTGIASTGGTVTGFGSLVVDGERWDDRSARIETEINGAAVPADPRLGQRVQIDYASRGSAERIVVAAEVIGRVTEVDAGATPPRLRVTGQIEDYNAGAGRFRLGDLTVTLGNGARVLPAGRALAGGQRVVVWSDEPLGGSAAAPTLNADAVRIVERGSGDATRVEIAGVVSRYNAGAATFEIDGQPVNARNAVVVPASQPLADGRYVIASGSLDSGVLQARQVKIRSRTGNDVEVSLTGSITEFVSAASFRVRNVAVNAAGVSALPGCGAGGLAAGVFVEIEGRIVAGDDRIAATRVRCESDSGGRVQSFEGIAGNVNTAARSFTLAGPGASTRSVSWSATTVFDGVTPETLANRSVVVDGYVQASVVIATRVRAR